MSEDDEVERLRKKWGIMNLPFSEASTIAKSQAKPRPSKVLVERSSQDGHPRWFFVAVDQAGGRSALFSTTNPGVAQEQAEYYQKKAFRLSG